MNFFSYKVEADDLHDKCNDPLSRVGNKQEIQ